MKNPIPLFLIPLAETAGVNASRSSDKQFAQFVKKISGQIFSPRLGRNVRRRQESK